MGDRVRHLPGAVGGEVAATAATMAIIAFLMFSFRSLSEALGRAEVLLPVGGSGARAALAGRVRWTSGGFVNGLLANPWGARYCRQCTATVARPVSTHGQL